MAEVQPGLPTEAKTNDTLSHASCLLATGMADPTIIDMLRLKRVARHLRGNFAFQEQFQKLTLYTDSDWGTDQETR